MGMGVLADVRERLLGHAEERELYLGRQPAGELGGLHYHGHAGALLEIAPQAAQRRHQP
jgi:hypothetical protein